MRLTILILCILSMMGCTTQRRATQYMVEHKEVLAKLCLDCFGDKKEVVYKEGTVTIDTIREVDTAVVTVQAECPDGTRVAVACPPNEVITVTKSRIDSVFQDRWQTLAELVVVHGEVDSLQATVVERDARIMKLEKQLSKWRSIALWSLGAIGATVLVYAIRKRLKL